MAVFKATIVLQIATNVDQPNDPIRRIGGWTESWYWEGTTLQALLGKLGVQAGGVVDGGDFGRQGLLGARANLLGKGGAVVAVRVQGVDPVGPSQVLSVSFPGSVDFQTDQPTTALLYTIPGVGVRNIRRHLLRGIPDAMSLQGEFAPSNAYNTALRAYFTALADFRFRGRDLATTAIKIIDIKRDASPATTGTARLEVPYTGALNDMVRILKASKSDGDFYSAVHQVTGVADSGRQLTLYNWPNFGVKGGKLRKEGILYPAIDSANIAVGRLVTRRVGRPFVGYRGRRSKRTPPAA